ncbi:MAG: hypothetical protein JXA57_06835 [Armatimonadetes bacterium]|nr:hypothetical protein [Armatimonadota bacterium]
MIHRRGADLLYEKAYHASRQLDAGQVIGQLHGQDLENFLDIQLLGEYMLLAGYALECALKGCLAAMDPRLVADEEGVIKRVATHNLPALCRRCGVQLSAEEGQLLTLITRYVKWGKYPGPARAADMPGWEESDEYTGLGVPNAFLGHRVQSLVDHVFARIVKKLDEQRKLQEERVGSTSTPP